MFNGELPTEKLLGVTERLFASGLQSKTTKHLFLFNFHRGEICYRCIGANITENGNADERAANRVINRR